MKYCAKCGNPMEDDMMFCQKCGTKFEGVIASAQTGIEAKIAKMKKYNLVIDASQCLGNMYMMILKEQVMYLLSKTRCVTNYKI